MDAAYLQAAHPEPFTILSVKLRPFCMGHELLFQRFNVAYSVENPRTPTIKDVLKAVYICSRPYRVDEDLEGVGIPFRARVHARLFGQKYVDAALIRFHQYVASHTELPEYTWEEKAKDSPSGAPFIQAVKVSLMANLGFSESEAMNMPFSLAFWNHLTWAEGQGGIQIVKAEARDAHAEFLAQFGDKLDAMSKSLLEKREEVSCSA